MPQGQMARDLYEAMETARCEAVGARDMPGTAGNIDARSGRGRAPRLCPDPQAADAPLPWPRAYLIRHLATGRDLPGARQRDGPLARFHRATGGGTLEP
jgi:cobaltochelatase CobT